MVLTVGLIHALFSPNIEVLFPIIINALSADLALSNLVILLAAVDARATHWCFQNRLLVILT